jgi:hypothetical protein
MQLLDHFTMVRRKLLRELFDLLILRATLSELCQGDFRLVVDQETTGKRNVIRLPRLIGRPFRRIGPLQVRLIRSSLTWPVRLLAWLVGPLTWLAGLLTAVLRNGNCCGHHGNHSGCCGKPESIYVRHFCTPSLIR